MIAEHKDLWKALVNAGETSFNFNKTVVHRAITALRKHHEKDWNISTKKSQEWDVSMTDRFRSMTKYFGNARKRQYKWAQRIT